MAAPLHLWFLVDALGWEIVRRTGFGEAVLARSGPLRTVLGYSSAAIPSLLTGTTPAEHGLWAMYRRADGRGPFRRLRWLPPLPRPLEWRARRWVRRRLDASGRVDAYYDLYEIPLRVLPHFDLAARGDPYRAGGLPRESVLDRLEADGIPYRVWDHRVEAEAAFDAALAAVDDEVDVLFVYTAELDALMHRVGTRAPEVDARLRRYERFVTAFRDRAVRAGRDPRVTVFSDHGMTDVVRTVDLWGALDRRGLRVGRDYVAFFDSTMGRFWEGDEAAAAAEAVLRAAAAGRRMDDDALQEAGCRFPDGRYGRTIVLADPGVLFVPSFMGSEPLAAMHGYDPADPHSAGCILTDADGGAGLPRSILGVKDHLLAGVCGGGA